ncbi:MAG TPA: extracellular solute-binding protein [Chthonomonadaceae bacterium]|nr:extracellular solute-binding protein [Chthonomonadaceae bacterium]
MKRVFLLFFLLCVALYVAAEGTLERPKRDGIVHMRWATDDNPARKVQTDLFHKLYPRLDATVDPGLGGDQTKLIVQCATGTGPDIIDVYDQQQLHALVDTGILLDLTPYAKKMGFDPSKTYPAIAPALMVDGKQYRFPCNVWANCVLYNKQIFDDHGVPYPRPNWTYADFIATCKQILNNPSKSGQKHLAVANWLNTWFVQDLLMGYGGRFFTKDGLRSRLDSPEAIATMQKYYNLMYEDKVIPTAAEAAAMSSQGGWGSSGLNWFSSGKAAMIFIGRWYIVQVPNYPNLRGHLGAVLLPRVGDRPSCGVTDSRAAGINVKSPHWREALSFLQYLAGPDYGKVIVEDGDSLPPNPQLARTGKDLVDAAVEDPAFHAPFIQAMKNARPLDVSPFIDMSEVARWFSETIDKVENRLQTPPEAMRFLADEIDTTIRQNLERRPDLQHRFAAVTGRPYTPDWWRAYQPH